MNQPQREGEIEKILESFIKSFGHYKINNVPLEKNAVGYQMEYFLRKELSSLIREERKAVIEEIVAIEKKNIDEEFDTMDFDGFAEDMILWLNRNKI
jgi:hypothetical protein